MKKEFCALGLLLLILTGNIWNQRRLEALTTNLETQVEEAYVSSKAKDWAEASAAAKNASADWLGAEGYTHIFIRHTDIDALTAAFCSYRGAVASRDEGDILSAYLLLKSLIRSLRGMEQLSPGSIL